MQDTPPPSPTVTAALDTATTRFVTLRAAYAQAVSAVADLDRLDAITRTGHRSLGRLLEELLRVDRGEARRLITHARRLTPRDPEGDTEDDTADDTAGDTAGRVEADGLPATTAALSEGAIGPGHLDVIAATMHRARQVVPPPPPGVLDVTEQQLVGLARERTPSQLADTVTEEILPRLDPDGEAPHDTERPVESLRMSINRRGECTGRFRFADPDIGQRIYDEITARTPPPDPTADTTVLRPGRDPDERRAEGLRHLVDDATGPRPTDDGVDEPCTPCADDHPDPGARPDDDDDDDDENDPDDDSPLLDHPEPGPRQDRARGRGGRDTTMIVTVPLDILERRLGLSGPHDTRQPPYALLDGRHPLSPETARRLACDAAVVPAVLGTHGEILDLGRTTRTVTTAQRRAVITRDRHCAHPGCRRSPRRCDVHHIIPWSHGGPTDLDLLVLLCPLHHHRIHHSPWQIHMRHRRPVFIPPAYLDPLQRPRANHLDHRPEVA